MISTARRFLLASTTALGCLTTVAGCRAILGLHEKELEDPDSSLNPDAEGTHDDGPSFPSDRTTPEDGTGGGDAAEDSPASTDAHSDCPFDAAGNGDFTAPACWTTFDLALASPALAAAPGTEG